MPTERVLMYVPELRPAVGALLAYLEEVAGAAFVAVFTYDSLQARRATVRA